MSAKASGSSAANGSAQSRNAAPEASEQRTYTVEQKSAVLRVRRCTPTAFYDILGLEATRTTCTDGDIKKAYRKLSLLTHPDKNNFEGADEAFKSTFVLFIIPSLGGTAEGRERVETGGLLYKEKTKLTPRNVVVSRAFQILSDSDKRTKFDRFGGDPDNRFSNPSPSPFGGAFSRAAGGAAAGQHPGASFQAEMTPEELFQQFFGGGFGGGGGLFGNGGGGMFDTGPQFVFNLGGGPGAGFRMHQFGGPNVRRRPHNHTPSDPNRPPASLAQILTTLLPLILVIILPMLTSFLSTMMNPPTVLPTMHFDSRPGSSSPLTMHRTTPRLKVDYYVDPHAVEDWSMKRLRSLDSSAEVEFVNRLRVECEIEVEKRNKLRRDAMGWFGIDREILDRADAMDLRSCRRLERFGIRL
ncbi:MAG: hypothetical protein M1814_006254 [Vezdaea aestivalis]|nr:MAG: hypothetical protein M1814_006254 [Vezdaea aestivalis]